MAAENMSDWSATPATINEAVWAAKQYLDDLFDRYETLEELENLELGFQTHSQSRSWDEKTYQKIRVGGVGGDLIALLLGQSWKPTTIDLALASMRDNGLEAQAARLRAREERQKAKAEAARQEANRLKEEAERKAQQEQERKAKAEQKRIEAEEKRKAEEAAAQDMDEAEAILREFAEQEKRAEKTPNPNLHERAN